MQETIVVIGNGMVGHKFIELMRQHDTDERFQMVTFCEEPRVAYDRIHLTEYFSGKTENCRGQPSVFLRKVRKENGRSSA